MDAFALLCRTEGIIPAIESAHAVAGAVRIAPELGPGATMDDLDLDLFCREYLPAAVPVDLIDQNQRTPEQQLASMRFLTPDSSKPSTAASARPRSCRTQQTQLSRRSRSRRPDQRDLRRYSAIERSRSVNSSQGSRHSCLSAVRCVSAPARSPIMR